MGAIWKSSPQQSGSRQEFNLAGGLNNGTPAFSLQDNEVTDEYGFTTDKFPALHTRGGHLPYGAVGTSRINLLTYYGTSHLFRAMGAALQWDNIGTWTTVTTLTLGADMDATNFNNKLIITNGSDPVKVWNGTAISDLNANAPKGKYITNDTVRVWIAKDDILNYSAYLNETDWITNQNSGSVQYYTPNGGFITGLANFANHICVFKKDSFAEIFGTDYFNFRMIENSDNIGCVAYKTIQEVSETLFWLGQRNVYMYRGGKPVPIGEKIRKFLDTINKSIAYKCVGGTDGIRYFLGLVTGTSNDVNVWLSYDPRYGIWRIESINDRFTFATFFNNDMYTGDETGQTYKMNQGTSDNGTAIPWMVTTKDFDEGIPEAFKEYYELHLQAYVPTGTIVTVSVSTNEGNTYTTVGDPIASSSLDQNINIIIPLDTVPLTNWIRFKFSGTGEFTLYNIERYFRVEPVLQ